MLSPEFSKYIQEPGVVWGTSNTVDIGKFGR
jgi:hypothetical protein